MSHTRRLYRPLTLILAGSLAIAGCRDPRRVPHAVTVAAAPAVDDKDPAAVARGFLQACLSIHQIGQRGMRAPQDREEFKQAEGRVMALADRKGIIQRWKNNWGNNLSAASMEERVDKILKNWPSIVANYVDSMRRDSKGDIVVHSRLAPGLRDAQEVTIEVQATEPNAVARLKQIRNDVGQMKNVRDEPLKEGSEEFEIQVHRLAAQAGISPEPGATIVLGLRETESGWRVTTVELAPLPSAASRPAIVRAAPPKSASAPGATP